MSSSADPTPGASARNPARLLAASVALGLVAGCGGGGGGVPPPPPPPPANQAPVFTSGTSATTVENNSGAVYQAAAADPDGGAVSYVIAGGADAARFSLSASGLLTFNPPPNFERPADADGNNVYQVQIVATDGQAQTTQSVSITVTNSKEGVAVRRIATGFDNPVAMASIPLSDIFVIGEKNGAIYFFNPVGNLRNKIAQIPVSGPGLLAVTINPQGPNGNFIAMYTDNGFLVVQEFAFDASTSSWAPHFSGPILRVAAPGYEGGGWLGFDTQGNLVIATGDAGGVGDPNGSAQDDSSFLGKLIRGTRNPNPAGPYYILTRIAKGLHQPAGGNYVSTTFVAGLLIGDRGQAVAEEIDYLANGTSGANFGWPFKEGLQVVRGTPPAGVVDPVADYPRVAGAVLQGTIGGTYAGPPVQSIAGDYVFADRSGEIFTLPVSETGPLGLRMGMERRTADFVPDVGTINQPAAIVADRFGRLYILDGDGEIFVVDAG